MAEKSGFFGHYYMLGKVFVTCNTPQGSFKNSLAVLGSKTEEDEPGMYLI